jgi:Kef-type K+ transport system membrane component KefB
LVLLAVVTGAIATGGAPATSDVLAICLKAVAFLALSLTCGVWAAPHLMRAAAQLRASGTLLAAGLGLCFGLAWLASVAGLAPIVGAFAAGLVLEDAHYRDFTARGELGLDKLVAPIGELLVPVFFVLMGMRTDLGSLLQPGVPLLAAALVVVAVLGKIVAGLAAGRGVDKLAVGLGMIPRGEVGLIFASIGQGLRVDGRPVINAATYGAVLVMVVVTTLMTPVALRWRLGRPQSA